MGIVGGSRHYDGGGLGPDGLWKCPACGAENTGPMQAGCPSCGAGSVGAYRAADAPRPTAAAAPPPPPPPRPSAITEAHGSPQDRPVDFATEWAIRHAQASIEEAYRAGYEAGVRAGIQAAARHPQELQVMAEPRPEVEARAKRTIAAALAYFADQVLPTHPDEVESGEWCSVEEVRDLMTQFMEPVHAH